MKYRFMDNIFLPRYSCINFPVEKDFVFLSAILSFLPSSIKTLWWKDFKRCCLLRYLEDAVTCRLFVLVRVFRYLRAEKLLLLDLGRHVLSFSWFWYKFSPWKKSNLGLWTVCLRAAELGKCLWSSFMSLSVWQSWDMLSFLALI